MHTTTKPVQLHIVHALGGGIERWYRDYCRADADRINLILKPFADAGHHGAGLMLFTSAEDTEPSRFWFFDAPFGVITAAHPEYRRVVAEIVEDYAVAGILVSSLIGHSLDILATGLPTLLVTHDYFPFCPAIYAYFNGPCERCDDARIADCHAHNHPAFNPFAAFPVDERIGIRHRFLELLRQQGITLVHPTAITRSNWRRLARLGEGEIHSEVIAHGCPAGLAPVHFDAPAPGSRLRILVLGLLNEHKGLNLLLESVPRIAEFADLCLAGTGQTGKFFAYRGHVEVIDSYAPDELPALVARFKPDIGLLASVCAETFSYVLTELTAMGIPALASRVGSFVDRIEDGETGYLFAPDATDLLATLNRIDADRTGLAAVRTRILATTQRTAGEMVAAYHHVLPLPHAGTPAATRAEAEPRWQQWARKQAVANARIAREVERLRHGAAIMDVCLGDSERQLAEVRHELGEGRRQIVDLRGRLDQSEQQATQLQTSVAERDRQLLEYDRQLSERVGQLAERDRLIAEREQQLANKEQHLAATIYQLRTILESTSWTVTRPLRVLSRLFRGQHQELLTGLRYHVPRWGKALYWHLPVRWREPLVEFAYRAAGPVFKGSNGYVRWSHRDREREVVATVRTGMVDIDTVPPYGGEQPGRIAIHAHIFYGDLAGEFAAHFAHMPFRYDLYVSVPDEATRQLCEAAFSPLPRLDRLTVAVVPNRGRDIAPMLCAFGEQLRDYDYLAHVQSKKSLYNQGRTAGWREYLLGGLLGGPERIKRIFALLTAAEKTGIVYPQTHLSVPYQAHTWLATRGLGLAWCPRLDIDPIPSGYFDFPAGSMFWARGDALRPLFDAGIRLTDFPPEQAQTDGTLAHCIERLLGLLPSSRGYAHAILRDTADPSWSRWRCEGYFARSLEGMCTQLTQPAIQVVAFDIFDTLLSRPLTDPEHVKLIVARAAGQELGAVYLAERSAMEGRAREKAGRDVGLDAIYGEWSLAKSLTADQLTELRALEESVEIASVHARPDAVALFDHALAAGKRVVLISDMFLPEGVIAAMLAANGIAGWGRLYLSNRVGLRKDSGELYRHLLSEEGVQPEAVAMVGDNERSDVQIPGDMGFAIHHVLRATEFARGLPRWGALIERYAARDDADVSVGLGLILRHRFAPLFYPGFRPEVFAGSARDIGYTVAGPVTLAFAAWLASRAEADGVARLYFLSREGAILKRVYDRWRQATGIGPASEYLVLSRRAVSVPMIADIEDVFELARTHFFPNEAAMFLRERYGLTVDAEAWHEIEARGLWRRDAPVEVRGKNIDHLKPLLEHLYPAIARQAADEHSALTAYLDSLGITAEGRHALVDVGYSATIQGRLNRLMGRPVHGYYMLTNVNAKAVGKEHGVLAQGCFADGVIADDESVPLNFHSFKLEKLLSSDEEQITRYVVDTDGSRVRAVFRENCETIRNTQGVRGEIQAGLMAFVDDALAARQCLHNAFVFPVELASSLFEAFVTDIAPPEMAILEQVVLDDYYCGRGLVA